MEEAYWTVLHPLYSESFPFFSGPLVPVPGPPVSRNNSAQLALLRRWGHTQLFSPVKSPRQRSCNISHGSSHENRLGIPALEPPGLALPPWAPSHLQLQSQTLFAFSPNLKVSMPHYLFYPFFLLPRSVKPNVSHVGLVFSANIQTKHQPIHANNPQWIKVSRDSIMWQLEQMPIFPQVTQVIAFLGKWSHTQLSPSLFNVLLLTWFRACRAVNIQKNINNQQKCNKSEKDSVFHQLDTFHFVFFKYLSYLCFSVSRLILLAMSISDSSVSWDKCRWTVVGRNCDNCLNSF